MEMKLVDFRVCFNDLVLLNGCCQNQVQELQVYQDIKYQQKSKKQMNQKVKKMTVLVDKINVLIVNDRSTDLYPLLFMKLTEINLIMNSMKETESGTLLIAGLVDYYNLNICQYEPFIEQTVLTFDFSINKNNENKQFLSVELPNDKDICNINVSGQLVRLINHMMNRLQIDNDQILGNKHDIVSICNMGQYMNQFKIENQTGYEIVVKKQTKVFKNEENDDSDEQNNSKSYRIANGQKSNIEFSYNEEKLVMFKILVEESVEDRYIQNINLERLRVKKLKMQDGNVVFLESLVENHQKILRICSGIVFRNHS